MSSTRQMCMRNPASQFFCFVSELKISSNKTITHRRNKHKCNSPWIHCSFISCCRCLLTDAFDSSQNIITTLVGALCRIFCFYSDLRHTKHSWLTSLEIHVVYGLWEQVWVSSSHQTTAGSPSPSLVSASPVETASLSGWEVSRSFLFLAPLLRFLTRVPISASYDGSFLKWVRRGLTQNRVKIWHWHCYIL